MSNYKKAIEVVLKNEGGYSKNPVDNGGETFKGIARKFYPKWEGWVLVDINHFDPRLDDMVIQFYHEQFWDKLGLDNVQDEFIAQLLLDFGVNIGKKKIAQKIQRILGVTRDGFIGPITIGKLNETVKHNRSEFSNECVLQL